MEPFIQTDQYHFIKVQVQNLVNGHANANDADVLHALKSLVMERISALFPSMNDEQMLLMRPAVDIDDKEKAEIFLAQLKLFVIPFDVTEQGIKKLFPKVKKLKVPSLEHVDMRDVSYLGWNDSGAQRKYIVTRRNGALIGLQGSFTPGNKKGICALCNYHEEVGMFLAELKGKEQDTFIKRGNYICNDSRACSEQLTSLDKLHDFFDWLKG